MVFRNYFVGTLVAIFVLFGPPNSSWPYWLNVGLTVSVPLIAWVVCWWIWENKKPTAKVENLLFQVLNGLISMFFLYQAFLTSKRSTHYGNTEYVHTHDGIEAIGDEIELTGPDWGDVLLKVFIALLFVWYGVYERRNKKHSDTFNNRDSQ